MDFVFLLIDVFLLVIDTFIIILITGFGGELPFFGLVSVGGVVFFIRGCQVSTVLWSNKELSMLIVWTWTIRPRDLRS